MKPSFEPYQNEHKIDPASITLDGFFIFDWDQLAKIDQHDTIQYILLILPIGFFRINFQYSLN